MALHSIAERSGGSNFQRHWIKEINDILERKIFVSHKELLKRFSAINYWIFLCIIFYRIIKIVRMKSFKMSMHFNLKAQKKKSIIVGNQFAFNESTLA